ncbi:MAG: LysM peptidoglycan-binding domain-containing protein, partial [Bacteroidota bacterium]
YIDAQNKKAEERARELGAEDSLFAFEGLTPQMVEALAEDDVKTLAEKAGVLESKFIKYNDLDPDHQVVAGMIYYRRAKKNKSTIATHVMTANENLWLVAQKYGVKLKKIRQYNRIKSGEPKAGTVLWLSKKMPKGMEPVMITVNPQYIHGRAISPAASTKPANEKPTKAGKKEVKDTVRTSVKPTKLPPIEPKKDKVKKPTKVKVDPIVEKVPDPKEETALTVEETSKQELDKKVKQLDFDIHEVAAGQTLFAIARKYGVSVNDLIEWNNLDPYNTIISIGQKLELKRPFVTPEKVEEIPTEKALYHVVQPGETAYAIARKYDITVDQLIGWNKLDEQASISIGQKLKVSGVFVEQKVPKKVKKAEEAEETKPAEKEDKYHEVGPGDTLYSLSRQYNISVKDLIRINQKSGASINIGERLKIKE